MLLWKIKYVACLCTIPGLSECHYVFCWDQFPVNLRLWSAFQSLLALGLLCLLLPSFPVLTHPHLSQHWISCPLWGLTRRAEKRDNIVFRNGRKFSTPPYPIVDIPDWRWSKPKVELAVLGLVQIHDQHFSCDIQIAAYVHCLWIDIHVVFLSQPKGVSRRQSSWCCFLTTS